MRNPAAKRTCGRLAAVALTLVSLACARPTLEESLAAPDPLLWEATAPSGAVLHLFGSIHVGTEALQGFGPVVEQAFARSEEIVVEIDPREVEATEIAALYQRWGLLPRGERLEDWLRPETRTLLQARLDTLGVRWSEVAGFRPWLVAIDLGQRGLAEAGFDPALGVDQRVIADSAALPLVALETLEFQLRTFAELPRDTQDALLRDLLEHGGETEEQGRETLGAWARGDARALETLLVAGNDDPALDPFVERVFFARNRSMTERLVELASDGRHRFVVVGAGHLVGGEGIPRLLADRGFEVRQTGGQGASSPAERRGDERARSSANRAKISPSAALMAATPSATLVLSASRSAR